MEALQATDEPGLRGSGQDHKVLVSLSEDSMLLDVDLRASS